MTVLVHFSGPSYAKTAVLQPGAPPIDVGRDPQAGIYLPDQDRLISRRHITIEWDAGGVKINVLSKVNGVTTPRGEFTMGQSVVLAPGETAQVGRFTFTPERQAAGAPAMPRAATAPAADDPFGVFGNAAAPGAGPASVFDDPFFLPTQQAQPAPQMEMHAALDVMSGKAAAGAGNFSGSASSQADPLAAFGGNQPPAHSSVSIDEFLGAPAAGGGGLGAASLLKPQSHDSGRRIASDHVHDFNLPLQPTRFQPADMPPLATPPASVGPLNAWLPEPAVPPAMPAPMAPPAPAMPARAPAAAPAPAADNADPWAAFAQEWVPSGDAKKPPGFPSSDMPLNRALDDAFSSSTAWRVEDMPMVDPLASASFDNEKVLGAAFSLPSAAAAAPRPTAAAGAPAGPVDTEAALRALCKGLGIMGPPQLQQKDWEQLGQSLRQIVQGLNDLMNVRAELKREMRAADRTMLGAQENNPLKSAMPIEELLHYLLFMPQGAAGYMPVQRALDESIDDLRAHEFATLAAVRTAVEGSIREFDPAKLRTTLLKGKRSIAGMLDNARLWDLYTTHYEQKGQHMADWLEQMFSRHFMPAYSRESDRMRREAQAQRAPAAKPPPSS